MYECREQQVKASDRIGNYILIRELGRGISASTWLAEQIRSAAASVADATDESARIANEASADAAQPASSAADSYEPSQLAVLKILDLSEAGSWNIVESFRREAEALKTLSYPGIPRYFEYFEAAEENRIRLVIAMEYIEGRNLESIIQSGQKFTETEVEHILAQLCDILAYLGSLRPPIIHRDVNPRNILMKQDGTVALVDFSGVQDAVRTALFPGATLVGTAGYIPLEQVAGKASHRSDLYGAAATAVFLLTGRNPSELPSAGLRINLDGIVELSPRLKAVLGSWLDPDVAKRNLSAADAAMILRGERDAPLLRSNRPSLELPRDNTTVFDDIQQARTNDRDIRISGLARKIREAIQEQESQGLYSQRSGSPVEYPEKLPSDSKVTVTGDETGLVIKIPRMGMKGQSGAGIFFPIFWLGFVGFWTMMTIGMRAPIFFPFFSLPFWGVGIFMAKAMLGPALTSKELVLTADGLLIRTGMPGFEKATTWPLADIGKVRVVNSATQVNNVRPKELLIEAGSRHLRIGTGLSERELLYLEKSMRETLNRMDGLQH